MTGVVYSDRMLKELLRIGAIQLRGKELVSYPRGETVTLTEGEVALVRNMLNILNRTTGGAMEHGVTYGLVGDDGYFDATVCYYEDEPAFNAYKRLGAGPTNLATLAPDCPGYAERVNRLIDGGTLVCADLGAYHGLRRIDDRRPGHSASYIVWDLSGGVGKPCFAPFDVYLHVSDEVKGSVLATYYELMALLDETSDVLEVNRVDADLAGRLIDEDPKAKEAFPVENRVAVFDLGEIARGLA